MRFEIYSVGKSQGIVVHYSLGNDEIKECVYVAGVYSSEICNEWVDKANSIAKILPGMHWRKIRDILKEWRTSRTPI